jgi:hypothetical protein
MYIEGLVLHQLPHHSSIHPSIQLRGETLQRLKVIEIHFNRKVKLPILNRLARRQYKYNILSHAVNQCPTLITLFSVTSLKIYELTEKVKWVMLNQFC